ncbi:MAG: anti-sigma factor antagonist [Actinomycetota bacterium]|jgi:anti-sigma B factor antagonist|nr:anti-sigma factor antagonist [Actinomycetota bacterium]
MTITALPPPMVVDVLGTEISVHGEVDIATAPLLRSALAGAVAMGARLTVDLAGVTFMDAAGVGVLAGAATLARRVGGDLVLRDPSRPTLRVLDLTRLLDAMAIETTGPRA